MEINDSNLDIVTEQIFGTKHHISYKITENRLDVILQKIYQ